MSDGGLCLHVGLPKCGSTSLQHNLFAKLQGMHYHALARKGGSYAEDGPFGAMVRTVREGADLNEAAPRFADWFSERRRADGPHLVSEERFTGIYGMGIARKPAWLHAAFGPARILLVLRRPAALIGSVYYQERRYERYGLQRPHRFGPWLDAAIAHADHHLSPVQYLRFDAIASAFANVFGEAAVTVVPLEWMNSAPTLFAARIAPAIGVEAEAVAQCLAQPRQALNTRPKALLRPAGGRRGLSARLQDLRASIGAPKREEAAPAVRFAEPDVRAIAKRWDLPLEALGYTSL